MSEYTSFYTDVSKHGNFIFFRGLMKDKKSGVFSRINKKFKYEPILYVPDRTGKNGMYTALDGTKVGRMDMPDMKTAKEFLARYEHMDNFNVYGMDDFALQFIHETFPFEIKFNRDLINVLSLDIETLSENGFPDIDVAPDMVTAITVRSSLDDNYRTWGLKEWSRENSELDDSILVDYVQCKDEAELLSLFLRYWIDNYPDIITGWNVRMFDIPYLINRMILVLGEDVAKKFSPWSVIYKRYITIGYSENVTYTVQGIQQLDYMELFKKFGYAYGTQESYRLDYIAMVVLGDNKLDLGGMSLSQLYHTDHQKYIDYNIKDVNIIDRFEEQMDLITIAITVAYKSGTNLSDSFGTVKVWDSYIAKELAKSNIVIPPKKFSEKEGSIKGGYVKIPVPSKYGWVASFDLQSLYPHIMMMYNMSPETIVQGIVNIQGSDKADALLERPELGFDHDAYCMASTGQLFDRNKEGVIPTIVERVYNERSEYKNERLKKESELEHLPNDDFFAKNELKKEITRLACLEQAIKILMNSLYGAMTNQYFRYFDIRIGEGITVTGQMVIKWTEKVINEFLNKTLKTDKDYIIAIDTDSVYVDLQDIVDKIAPDSSEEKIISFIDKLCREVLNEKINESYEELQAYTGAKRQMMHMKREVIAESAVWTGKKRYAMMVWDKEGVRYEAPKLKIVGIEAVKSSTPRECRETIRTGIELVLTSTEEKFQSFLKSERDRFKTLSVEDIAFPRGVSNITKYHDSRTIYASRTPMHVRASLLYNNLLGETGVGNNYDRIKDGDKMKFVYLKVPNTIRENVIGFSSELPIEFGLHKYIDYDLQYDKAVISPLDTIAEAARWNTKRTPSLKGLFNG